MGDREKRRAKRIAYPCEVEVYGTGSGRVQARTTVLSIRGAFIESGTTYPVGTHLVVRLKLPAAITLAAEVAHVAPSGMGVHFLGLTREQHRVLQGLLGDQEKSLGGVGPSGEQGGS